MTHDEYLALPGLSATAIKAGATSMRHMHAVITRESDRDTAAMRWGRLVHGAILEPGVLFARLSIFNGRKYGAKWDEFNSEHGGENAVTGDELAALMKLSASVYANPYAAGLITNTAHEVVLRWEDEHYGKAKARLDGAGDSRTGVLELKTARAIDQRTFGRQFVGLGYDIQCGWYVEGVCRSGDAPTCPVTVVAVESSEPYDVVVYAVPQHAISAGRRRAKEIATRYRECERNSAWPGISCGIQEIELPAWYLEGNTIDDVMPKETMEAGEL